MAVLAKAGNIHCDFSDATPLLTKLLYAHQ